MTTLIHIPKGRMRFVPAEKQTDEFSMELKPAKWPVELVLISNDMGREVYLDTERIRTILSPTIQAICRLKPEETTFFPPPLHLMCTTTLRTPTCPKRSLTHSPAIDTMISLRGPTTPHRAPGLDPTSTLAQTNPPTDPLRGGPTTRGLHIYTTATRAKQPTNPHRDIHTAVSRYGWLPTRPAPMDTEIYPRKLGLYRRLRH